MGTKGAIRRRLLPLAIALTCGGSLPLVIPSCGPLLTTVNPCGTIFAFCNARAVDEIFGTIPDYNLDPTCTIPFYSLDQGMPGGPCGGVEVYPNTPGPRPPGGRL